MLDAIQVGWRLKVVLQPWPDSRDKETLSGKLGYLVHEAHPAGMTDL